MTCKECTDAEADPTRDGFKTHCRSCEARALASIGAHIESSELRAITPQYRATLERIFGEDWKAGHELVRTWGQRIAAAAALRKPRPHLTPSQPPRGNP